MRFRFKFPSSIVESEYQRIKRNHTKTFCKLLIFVAVMIVIHALVHAICSRSIATLMRMTCISFLLVFLIKFADKLAGILDYFVLVLSFGLYLSGLYEIRTLQLDGGFIDLFYSGYTYAVLERIIILQLPRLELKIVFAVAGIISRLVLFPTRNPDDILSQIIIWIVGVIVDIWKEKDDRALFKSFHDYREELTKFKHLMVSGLPANILILTRDIKQKLFTNDNFHGTFQGRDSLESVGSPKEWLDRMIIEKETLNPASKEALTDEQTEVAMSLLFDKLNERHLFDDSEKYFAFNVRSQTHISFNDQKTFETKVFPLIWDGKESLAIIMNDLTQQYTNLSLKIADANKDKMLAMVSHELRTPLNGILGMISILEKKLIGITKDEEILSYLTVCKNSGKLLLNLVNSILDLGQIRNNKLSLIISRVNLQEMLREIFCLFEFQFKAKGLYLQMDVMSDIDQYIITDLNRLKQILINLIGNALKFTYDGGVKVYIGKQELVEGYLEFKVSDTGIGIKNDDLKKLFKMYGRLEQPNLKVNSEGIGLGLTISNHLVHLLSNHEKEEGILVESELGQGTTFSFSVKANLKESQVNEGDVSDTEAREFDDSPRSMTRRELIGKILYQPPRSPSFASAIPNTESKGRISPNLDFSSKYEDYDSFNMHKVDFFKGGTTTLNRSTFYPDHEDNIPLNKNKEKGHVLLVDDSPFNIMVAKHLIESLGYSVMTALNGEIAVEMMRSFGSEGNIIKTIFMDCQMPVMDGYEATAILRKMMKEGEIPEVPIVALSANDTSKDKDRCKDAGMCDHLSKSLDENSLRKVLGKYYRTDEMAETTKFSRVDASP